PLVIVPSTTNTFLGKNDVDKPLTKYSSSFVKGLPQKKVDASICVFISIGRDHCSGEQLRSLLQLLNKTFTQSHVIFILADRLQRFTNQLYGMGQEEAEKKGIQDGLAWRAKHESMIVNELTNLTYHVLHWSELTQAENYKGYENQVAEAYRMDLN